ncbi:MAG: PHP domain-containing protein [Myxococcales bacterium]|nr:PHP domain-containing protein [Myxococcales bacterium]
MPAKILLLVFWLAIPNLSCDNAAPRPDSDAVVEASAPGSGERGPHEPEGRGPWIEYPQPGQRVREATIPVWIRSDDGRDLDGLVVHLNGSDASDHFGPWGGRRQQGPRVPPAVPALPAETLGTLRPRPGANRIEIWARGAEGEPTATVDFQLEPHAMPLRVRVVEGGRDVPARVSFHGLDSTPDPQLVPAVWSRIAPKMAEAQRNFLYTSDTPEIVYLPAGRYEILATRGPAYSMARAVVKPGPADSIVPEEVVLAIERVVDTRGWISADFHVHTIASGDSSLPIRDRLASFRAQDVDAIVASDHKIISDYEADLGSDSPELEGISAIPGVESGTSRRPQTQGHWNFWPLARDLSLDERTRMGALSYGGQRPKKLQSVSELYAHFSAFNAEARRARFGDFPVVIQLNHPRGFQKHPYGKVARAHDYLDSMGYDPSLPLDQGPNVPLLARPRPDLPRPIDVDAIELLNRLAYGLYLEVRADWFAWIAEGFVPTGMANSDSHWIVITEAGYPRNWVRYDGPRPVEAEPLARAIRARQVVGSTGPLIELSPWTRDGSPWVGALDVLEVTVRGPAWMPIDEVRVWVNAELVAVRRLPPGPADPYAAMQQVHRIEIPLALQGDAFIVVEAGDDLARLVSPEPHAGPLGRAFPYLRVLAFTNPLLVDLEGDGTVWDRLD